MIPILQWVTRHALASRVVAGILAMSGACRADPPFVIDVWTPYQGLPQSRVLSIAQTPDGYLWVGTKLGWLARFDGVRFVQFSPENTPAMESPEIEKLLLDDRGGLWIGDIDGRLVQYANGTFENKAAAKPGPLKRASSWVGRWGNENRFATVSVGLIRLKDQLTYEGEANLDPAKGPIIDQFCQDSGGIIWCRTRAGRMGRWVDGAFLGEPDSVLPATARVTQLLSNPDGGLWIATHSGLWKRENGDVVPVPLQLPGGESRILQLARLPDGGLWLRTPGSLVLVREGEVVRSVALPGIEAKALNQPLEMHSDTRGGVWILKAASGIWHVGADGQLTILTRQNGLPSDQVEAWCEDREGNFWLGTAAGLVRLRPRWFEIVETESTGPGAAVVSVCEDAGGSIWLGRPNGLTRWNQDVAENIPLPPTRPGIPIADVTVAPGEFPDEVWLGTVPSGAMLLRDGRIDYPFPFQQAGMAIRMIRRDQEGGIWLGGEFGLFRWHGGTLRKFGPEDGLKYGHIHDMAFDSHGQPWIAKAEDLLAVYRNGSFESIPLPGLSRSLWINTVLCGAQGDIWLGTIGDGLFHITGGRILRYSTKDGLPGNSVTQLIEDDLGYLWGGTLRGIFRVSTHSLATRSKNKAAPLLFEKFGHTDGLTTAECLGGLQPACWKARDGRLWFSTSGGAVRIDPAEVKKNQHPPAVIIEELRVNESAVRGDPAGTTIEPGRHRYEFEFTGINFTAPEKLLFQWKLSSVDSEWIDGGNGRKASYQGLKPGYHQFSVRARNSSGVWSLEPATFRFHVTPFFWQRHSVRIAFAVGCLAAAYLLIVGVMRRKHHRKLRELEFARSLEQQRFRHKQAMEDERSRIAAELHDDLGANLTQIQWLGDAVTRAQLPATGENELIHRITRKSRDMVRLIDEIVWAVNPKNDTLEQLVTYVCNFAEQYFRDSPTRCRIDVAAKIPAQTLEADVRHHLFLIAKEALHNVAKHGNTDRVWVRVSIDDNIFKLLIEDRGTGFDFASAEAGDGLANMRNRAKLAGADLTIESSPGKGTRVSLSMKLNPHTD